MQGAAILDKLLEYTRLNGKSFSEKIGLNRPQAIYDIQSGKTQNISANMADKILSVFPEINRGWLQTGEGSMLKDSFPDKPNVEAGDCDLLASQRRIIETQAQTIERQSETINRQSKIIEALTCK